MNEKPEIIGAIFCQEDLIDTIGLIADAGKAGSSIVEIRLDVETKKGFCEPDLTYYKTEMKTISTCMTKKEGGFFKGTLDEWAAIMQKATDYGTTYISISLDQANTNAGLEVVEYAKEHKVKVIIGDHAQDTLTAEYIIVVLKEIKAAGADIAKVAYMAHDPKAVLDIMKASLHDLGIPKIMIAMGEYGKFWRAVSLCPPWKCWGMFASVGEATAPGQLSVKEITDILNILNKG